MTAAIVLAIDRRCGIDTGATRFLSDTQSANHAKENDDKHDYDAIGRSRVGVIVFVKPTLVHRQSHTLASCNCMRRSSNVPTKRSKSIFVGAPSRLPVPCCRKSHVDQGHGIVIVAR